MNATTTQAPQPELFDVKPDKASRDVAWLENLLKGGQCWLTASDVLLSVGQPATDSNKRWLRELASQSGYIMAGQLGYRHLEHCSPEEIHHCCAWLESQARLMAERAARLRRNAHKLFS